jgi:hypothetical protein
MNFRRPEVWVAMVAMLKATVDAIVILMKKG